MVIAAAIMKVELAWHDGDRGSAKLVASSFAATLYSFIKFIKCCNLHMSYLLVLLVLFFLLVLLVLLVSTGCAKLSALAHVT